MKINLSLITLFLSLSAFGQQESNKLPTYFGVQVRPIFPAQFISTSTNTLKGDYFETSITQRHGIGFGGIVRASITKLIAFETGLNFTQRNFDVSIAIPDSNVFAKDSLTYIEYDVPINALIYIQLSDKIYMNTSLGVAVTCQPTDTWVKIKPKGKHYFDLFGARKKLLGLSLNANIGFEFRTKKSGFFYLGGATRVPLAPLLTYVAHYRYDANENVIFGDINGSFLSVDFKYFFPIIKNKGQQFKQGPIE